MVQNEKYTLDGKESVNDGMMDSKVKSTLTWSADKKELIFAKVISFTMNGEAQEMKSTEKWSLSPDSKTLTIKSLMNTPMGEMNTTLAYEKKERVRGIIRESLGGYLTPSFAFTSGKILVHFFSSV